jgi:glycosyltransferase involved in cell wall biosynthesis
MTARARTVLVLPAWYPTAREPLSGPFVRDHARAAASYGHRMVVVVDEGAGRHVRGLLALSDQPDSDVRSVQVAYRPSLGVGGYLAGVLAVAGRLARQGTSVDVIHAHVHRMALPAVAAGAILRRPVVISEHSSEWPRRTIGSGALRRARLAFPRAALVCPVNGELRAAIESFGVRARFRIVRNAVDTRLFHPPEPVAGERVRLVNVALHVEVKGLEILLQAFGALAGRRKNATLELVGDGPLTPRLRRLAADLELGERVRFTGRISPAEVADRLRAADAFVLSSLSENLPLSLLEALCCGLPVAATNVGGVATAVGTDGRLAAAGDHAALARAMAEVLDRRRRFDRSAIARRAAARYSFAAVGGAWDAIYRSV